MKVAAIQLRVNSNYEENLKKAFHFMDVAQKEGADVISLPENFSFVKTDKSTSFKFHTLDGELVTSLRNFSKRNSVYLLAGSFIEKRDGYEKFFNTSIFIDREGKIRAIYRKIHLFDFYLEEGRAFLESSRFEGGNEIVYEKVEEFTFGLTICYDLRFPEIYRLLAKRGVNVFFIPSAFTLRTGRDHWEILLKARAIENFSYVIAPSLWGKSSEKIVNNGRSMILDPWGNILATAPDRECVIYGELDFNYLKEKRNLLQSLNHIKLI